MRRRTWAGFGLTGVGLVAAVGVTTTLTVGAPVVAPTDGASAQAEELESFRSCHEVRRWYAEAALSRVTAWGLGGPPVYAAMPAAAVEDATLGTPQAAERSAAVGNGETGTNVQEAGVDEPDLVKTDGELLVLLDGTELVLVDVTGDEPVELGRLALDDASHANEMLLVGDRVVLFGGSTVDPVAGNGRGVPSPLPGGQKTTRVTTVDISDPSAPAVVANEDIEGDVVSARGLDGIVRIVTSSTPALDFVTPGGTTSVREARAANRQIVREARTIDWLPTRTAAGGDLSEREQGGDTTRLVRCADVRHPDEESGLGTVSVLTLDPLDPEGYASTAVTADGSMVYASDDRLYVATTVGGWTGGWWGPWAEPTVDTCCGRIAAPEHTRPITEVHAFAVDGADTTYVASGEVRGTAPDRWAFSEHDGLLRVATMLGNQWSPRESAVTVLQETDGDLRPVGRIGGMGQHETIRAVRWFGDVAVLVTFQQTDPLYTVDLSDPVQPQVVGELKIPGFSEYLHPVGGDLLLGVGQDASLRGVTQGIQVSSFDLLDLSAPKRSDALGLGAGYSPVEQDSRAFTYLPDQRLALVPTDRWRGHPQIAVVHVGSDGSLDRADTVGVTGPAATVRALPLADGRVAVVGGGEALELLTLPGSS